MTDRGLAGTFLLKRLANFSAALREEGVKVSPDQQVCALQALEELGFGQPGAPYWALRLSLVTSEGQIPVFDRLYAEYWTEGAGEERSGLGPESEDVSNKPPGDDAPGGKTSDQSAEQSDEDISGMPVRKSTSALAEDGDGESEADQVGYSRVEVLLETPFRDYSSEDYQRIFDYLSAQHWVGPTRFGRRHRRHRHGAHDLRRTVRRSFRTGGDVLTLPRRYPRPVLRRVVCVCDVSGSMEPYSRAMMTLAHAVILIRRRVEAFVFATRLTRVTGELLTTRDPNKAFDSATHAAADWSGGTRVGESLDRLERDYRGAVQGAVVIVLSDGWDLGDPALLESACGRLALRSRSFVWANPHLEDPEFQPLTRGMAAALPFIDHLVECHNLDSLIHLIDLVDEL